MAISGQQVASSSTLETLRTQFNNLVTDVAGLEGGSISYTTLNTTTTKATTVEVKEDGSIIFEGATDDGFETTLTVVDPTADRTISLPNTSGTVVVSGDGGFTVADGGTIGSTSATDALTIASSGIVTFKDDILIKDGGTIGNASVADVLTLASTGIVTFKDDIIIKDGGTIGSATTPAAITIASNGDVTLSGDLTVSGDDITMGTNTAGNLLVADGTNFNSIAVSSLSEISSIASDDVFLAIDTSGGGLKKVARSVVVSGLATSSAISNVSEDSTPQLGGDLDVNGNALVSTSNGNIAITPNGSGVVRLDGNVDIQSGIIDLKNSGTRSKINFYCESGNAHAQTLQAAPHSESASNTLTLPSTGGDVDLVSTASTATLTNKTLTSPQITTSIIPSSADGATIGSASAEFSDLFLADGGTIQLGNDQDVTITHIADTGVRMNSSSKIQFTDANESIHSDGTNLILTSGGTAFKIPTSDGSNGQALVTNGSGTFSFGNVASAADDFTAGDAAVNLTTTSGNITIDAQGNDTDIIFKGTDGSADTTFLTIDGSEAGEATFNAGIVIADGGVIGSASDKDAIAIGSDGDVTLTQDLELQHDGAILSFGTNDEIALTHVHDTGLLLTDSGGSPTLQFHDSAESVSSDGSKLILTSNGVAFSLPTADGSNGDALKTNGSGTLSFGSVSSTGAFTAFEYTATAAQTTFSGNDDNSNSLSYSSGVNNVFVSVNGVMLDGSDYTATNGTSVVLSAAANANDMIKILATNASSITTTDLNGSELVLDADGDTSIAADTDDTIDIKISGADDFRFTANTLTALSGSSIVVPDGGLTFGTTAITATGAELNIIDGGTSATSTTVADADRVVLNDDGTMVQVAMTDIKTYIGGGTSWQAVKTSNFTASAGQGVFCDTSSAAFTLTLPASPTIGDEVAFKDYAKTFDTNNLTIARNGSKIEGATNDLTVDVEGAGNTLVFTDSTQGWLLRNK